VVGIKKADKKPEDLGEVKTTWADVKKNKGKTLALKVKALAGGNKTKEIKIDLEVKIIDPVADAAPSKPPAVPSKPPAGAPATAATALRDTSGKEKDDFKPGEKEVLKSAPGKIEKVDAKYKYAVDTFEPTKFSTKKNADGTYTCWLAAKAIQAKAPKETKYIHAKLTMDKDLKKITDCSDVQDQRTE
jgi:hypothetical protein